MYGFMISAPGSGSGKTVLTCGLLQAFLNRGAKLNAYKCGPDYIDPMFHKRVLQVPSRNLDLYLQGKSGVLRTLRKQKDGLAIIEGAMGYYDGVNGTEEASAYEVAKLAKVPVVLAVQPKGSSLTLAAEIFGLHNFREGSRIAGVILTNCKPMLYAHLKPVLERESGIKVYGYMPPMEEAGLESRHLGLKTAAEISDFRNRFTVIAKQLEKTVDLDGLLELAGTGEPLELACDAPEKAKTGVARKAVQAKEQADGDRKAPDASNAPFCKIAVAMDEAFCFYYEDNLEKLQELGAELVFFSPLKEEHFPQADGLYLGGGYPELYLKALSDRKSLREEILEQIQAGLPTLAECGGFLYLQKTLKTQAQSFPMVGVVSGEGFATDRLQRFGYGRMRAKEDSMLFQKGESVPVHEFHYWDTTENGNDFTVEKANGKTWECGFANMSLYAGFPHLHFEGETMLAQRFVDAAKKYRERKNQNA